MCIRDRNRYLCEELKHLDITLQKNGDSGSEWCIWLGVTNPGAKLGMLFSCTGKTGVTDKIGELLQRQKVKTVYQVTHSTWQHLMSVKDVREFICFGRCIGFLACAASCTEKLWCILYKLRRETCCVKCARGVWWEVERERWHVWCREQYSH